jgi:hypothetical protein
MKHRSKIEKMLAAGLTVSALGAEGGEPVESPPHSENNTNPAVIRTVDNEEIEPPETILEQDLRGERVENNGDSTVAADNQDQTIEPPRTVPPIVGRKGARVGRHTTRHARNIAHDMAAHEAGTPRQSLSKRRAAHADRDARREHLAELRVLLNRVRQFEQAAEILEATLVEQADLIDSVMETAENSANDTSGDSTPTSTERDKDPANGAYSEERAEIADGLRRSADVIEGVRQELIRISKSAGGSTDWIFETPD